MAFQEITATDRADIISKLETFALANGWFSASGGVFKARVGDTETFTITTTSIATDDGYIYVTPSSSTGANESAATNIKHSNGIGRVWMKCMTLPQPWIYCVVETSGDGFKHFGFGFVEDYGVPAAFYTGNGGTLNYSGDITSTINDDFSYLLGDYSFSDVFPNPGGFVYDGNCYSCGIGGFGKAGGGIPSFQTNLQYAMGNNAVNSKKALFRLRGYILPVVGGTIQPIGTIPLYTVELSTIADAGKITVGTREYICFPLSCRAATYPGIIKTGNYGFAMETD